MEVVFTPGSSIKAADLNADYDQLRRAIEESRANNKSIYNLIDNFDDIYLNEIDVNDGGDLVKSFSDLTINDEVVATTQWIDNRYWNGCDQTTYTADNWVNDIGDSHIPTTGAVENRLIRLTEQFGEIIDSSEAGVISVNGKVGIVQLVPSDIGAVEEAPLNNDAYVRKNGAWITH